MVDFKVEIFGGGIKCVIYLIVDYVEFEYDDGEIFFVCYNLVFEVEGVGEFYIVI